MVFACLNERTGSLEGESSGRQCWSASEYMRHMRFFCAQVLTRQFSGCRLGISGNARCKTSCTIGLQEVAPANVTSTGGGRCDA